MLSHRGGVAGASRCAAAALISWNRVRHGVRQDNWSEGRFECSWTNLRLRENSKSARFKPEACCNLVGGGVGTGWFQRGYVPIKQHRVQLFLRDGTEVRPWASSRHIRNYSPHSFLSGM